MRRVKRLAFVLFLTGCGSSELDTGLDAELVLSSATEEQRATFCEGTTSWAVSYDKRNQTGICRFNGYDAARMSMDAARCEEVTKTCRDTKIDESQYGCFFPLNCEVTVAEYESCFDAFAEREAVVFEEIAARSCEELVTETGRFSFLPELALPSACAGIDKRCPGANLDSLFFAE